MDRTIIEEWIKADKPFVVFREPGERCVKAISANSLQALADISELKGHAGYVFAPFRPSDEFPIWLLPEEEVVTFTLGEEYDDVPEAPAPVPFCGGWFDYPSASYCRTFQTFKAALSGGDFEKLVLSRKVIIPLPTGFSWLNAFGVACKRYVHSYVSLFYAPQTGFWLGATPEILLSGQEGRFQTVALAGTQVLTDECKMPQWSEKNKNEQCLVTDFIADILHASGTSPEIKGPITVTAGSLAHLKTEFNFVLQDETCLLSLLPALHPTPAVCGVEKSKAYEFIASQEGYDRSYYSGFLGQYNPCGKTQLYVNLRCMNGDISDHLCLYAGGGLLPTSVLEEEWLETERKLQTMKYVIYKCTQIRKTSCN